MHTDDPDPGSAHDHGSYADGWLELVAARETIAGARLSAREAQLIALRALGYTYGESAQLAGQSARTVERQLACADRKLRNARAAEEEGWR